MNNANKILTFLGVLMLTLFITSCVEDDDFGIPNVSIVEPDISDLGQLTTFSAVVSRYFDDVDTDEDGEINNGESGVGVFDDNDIDLYIVGYVVSSDKSGNFFEEIIVQNSIDDSDAGSDPRQGLKVEINVRSLSDTYEFGRKVYIKLNGLAIGEENGVYTLGKANGNALEQLQEFEYLNFIIRSAEVATITPKLTTIGDLTEADQNTLIQLENMQIHRKDVALTYAGEVSDQFDGFRILESCESSGSIDLQTSTFADFKSVQLPQNKGTITAIFTRDFGDDNNVLVINSTADIVFDITERCDPIELDCGLANSQAPNNIFEDDFQSQSVGSLISGNGWTNFIQEGTEGFEAYTQGGTNFSLGTSCRIGSFRSNDASSIAWLITPAINLDAQEGETFMFKTSNSFSDDSELELLFSPDWDGTEANITSATWGVLPAAYVVQDSDFFGDWFDSGIVDLSCGTGTIHIAFKYTGSGDADFDGTFEIDSISIDSQ